MTAHRYFCLVGVFLTIGACIYILFREPVIFTSFLFDRVKDLPLITLPDNIWSYGLRYVLPDALWCAALLSYASTMESHLMRCVAVMIASALEFGQLMGIIPGTFNLNDLTVYTLITLLFILIWKKRKKTRSQCL